MEICNEEKTLAIKAPTVTIRCNGINILEGADISLLLEIYDENAIQQIAILTKIVIDVLNGFTTKLLDKYKPY